MTPYRTTMVFDETTLPAALRREHRTKSGAWGIVRVLDGELRLHFRDGRNELLDPAHPGLIHPEETHWVELVGPMKMQVEFYDRVPRLTDQRSASAISLRLFSTP